MIEGLSRRCQDPNRDEIYGREWMLKKLLVAALLMAPARPANPAFAADSAALAFPGAVGPAAATPGGRGGKIIRVTTLAHDGPGSIKAAAEAKGPRINVFEVGGVIELRRNTLTNTAPFLRIPGQTAPGLGDTLIRPRPPHKTPQ